MSRVPGLLGLVPPEVRQAIIKKGIAEASRRWNSNPSGALQDQATDSPQPDARAEAGPPTPTATAPQRAHGLTSPDINGEKVGPRPR